VNIFDVLYNNASIYPDKPIWEDEKNIYTLSDMEYLSGKIYHYLKDNHIGKEDIVAISLPRGGNIPLVMLGVWKAGAAFAVIGEHTPKDLANYQLSQTKPKLIFTAEQYDEAMDYDFIKGYETVDEHNLACVVYSTGSSGTFKGSMHEFGAIRKSVDRSRDFCDYYGFSAIELNEYRLIMSAGFYSMSAVFSLIDSLVLCYYQYVLPHEKIGKIEEIKKILFDKKINSYLSTNRDYRDIKNLNSPYLKELSVSLDMISCSFSEEKMIYNYCGMSESVCVLTCFKVDKSYDITPIGKPYKDISMKIADKYGNTLTDGSIGEICFVPEFWRGYIGQPEKTNTVYYDGWFHTGDMGYADENGNYVTVGRKIDLAETQEGYIVPIFIEIEFRKAFSDAENCHVQIFKDNSNPVVCIYYCGKAEYTIKQIRQKLSDVLPEYCLPTHCRKMKAFQYYPSGKLKRNSFKNPLLCENK